MKRILILYATIGGSTAEVAEQIGTTIEDLEADVDVIPITDTPDNLDGYDGIIIGSGIRAGRWLPQAVSFVKQHQATLRRVPTAYFVVCLTMREDTPENRDEVMGYLDEVRETASPVDIGLFAGKLDYDQLSFATRMLARAMRAPEGDFRDWPTIEDWARRAGLRLLRAHQDEGTSQTAS